MISSVAKISSPEISGVLYRKRLFRLLDRYCRRPVIWVTGPPGSGKTTLAATYVESRNYPCLWYQLDEGDRDLPTFFYYLGLAVRNTFPSNRKPLPLLTPEYQMGLSTFTRRYFENLYTCLSQATTHRFGPLKKGGAMANVESAGTTRGKFLIVFDNYQDAPSDSKFQEIMAQGLEIIPPGIHVLVLSRREPPLPLARLKANEKIHLVGWDELRLTAAESKEIVRLKWRNGQPVKITEDIQAMTGGWAAGLVLMIETARREKISLSIADNFTRNDIFAYFAIEILNRLDRATQIFLVKTAFLPEITPRSAERLTGLDQAEEILAGLTRNNFFTVRHPLKENSYRYHPLFREFLLSRSHLFFNSEETKEIRRISAEALKISGRIEEAADLFLRAGDYEGLVRLIRDYGASLMEQGRGKTLKERLNALPIQTIDNDPWLQYWMGTCEPFDDLTGSRRYLEKAFRSFEALGDKTGLFLSWISITFLLAHTLTDIKTLDRWTAALDGLLVRFGGFPSEEIEMKVLLILFFAAISQSGYHNLDGYIERALHLGDRSKRVEMKIHLFSNLASYLIVRQGQINRAGIIIDQFRHLARRRDISPFSRISVKLSEALLYTFSARHEECLKAVFEGLKLAEETGIHTLDSLLLMQGIISALNHSDQSATRRLLENLISLSAALTRYDLAVYHWQMAIEAFCQNRLEEALTKIDLALPSQEAIAHPVALFLVYTTAAQIYRTSGRTHKAAKVLDKALAMARGIKAGHLESTCLLIMAHWAFQEGQEKTGLDLLATALALEREKGIFLTFIWEPAVKAELCAKALEAGIAIDYVQEFIRRGQLTPPGIWAEQWPYPLKIYTFGRFGILNEGKAVSFSKKAQQKPLTMLKALIALGGREVAEAQLADALWPEADGDSAHFSFKFTLHQLRKLIGNEKAIRIKEKKVTLDPRHCWVDVWAFHRLSEQAEALFKKRKEAKQRKPESDKGEQKDGGRLFPDSRILPLAEKAIALYQGDFLAGESEEQWIFPIRERLKDRFIRLVEMVGEAYEAAGEWKTAVYYYQKALDVNDLQEEFYRGIMRCYHRLGRRAEALAVYRHCRSVLETTLGIEPSEETEAVYRDIKAKTILNTPL